MCSNSCYPQLPISCHQHIVNHCHQPFQLAPPVNFCQTQLPPAVQYFQPPLPAPIHYHQSIQPAPVQFCQPPLSPPVNFSQPLVGAPANYFQRSLPAPVNYCQGQLPAVVQQLPQPAPVYSNLSQYYQRPVQYYSNNYYQDLSKPCPAPHHNNRGQNYSVQSALPSAPLTLVIPRQSRKSRRTQNKIEQNLKSSVLETIKEGFSEVKHENLKSIISKRPTQANTEQYVAAPEEPAPEPIATEQAVTAPAYVAAPEQVVPEENSLELAAYENSIPYEQYLTESANLLPAQGLPQLNQQFLNNNLLARNTLAFNPQLYNLAAKNVLYNNMLSNPLLYNNLNANSLLNNNLASQNILYNGNSLSQLNPLKVQTEVLNNGGDQANVGNELMRRSKHLDQLSNRYSVNLQSEPNQAFSDYQL